VSNYAVIDDLDATFDKMTGSWDPRQITFLNREPSIAPQPDGIGEASIAQYQPEYIKIEYEAAAPKLLILADTYYESGWRAQIDGVPTEILRADGVLRAVAAPAGKHTIEFRFRPSLFYIGLWISMVSLVGVIIIGGVSLMKSRKSLKSE
jgi:hypothetical protein